MPGAPLHGGSAAQPAKLRLAKKVSKPVHPGAVDDEASGDPSPQLPHQLTVSAGSTGEDGLAAAPSRVAGLSAPDDQASAAQPGTSASGGNHHGGLSHALPYVLGGVAVIGGGAALASKGGGSSAPKAPEAAPSPTLALAGDTGASASDGITNRSTIAVSNLQTDAKWEYSTDGGATWTAGTGSSFSLADGTYAADRVQARQTTGTGTVSPPGKLGSAVTIDTRIANPSIDKVTGDNVLSFAEAADPTGVVVRGKGVPGATIDLKWLVQDRVLVPTGTTKVDADGNWTYTFKGTAIPDASTRLDSQIRITATDVAGNVSEVVTQVVVTDPGLTVSGTITAGAVVAGNDLKVNLYTGAGKLLAANVAVAADGSFRADHIGAAVGDVLVATLANGPAADHVDEASGAARNLSANLIGAVVAGSSSVTLNVNPLTTVAAAALGLGLGNSGQLTGTATAASVTAALSATAKAFGLTGTDLAALTPLVYPVGSLASWDGLTSAQKAGVILAALSGVDASNGGNAQVAIDALARALTAGGAIGALDDASQAVLVNGAALASARLGTGLIGMTTALLASTTGPQAGVSIGPVAGDDVISRAELAGLAVTVNAPADATGVVVQLGDRTISATWQGTAWMAQPSAADLAALGTSGTSVIRAVVTLADGSTVTASRPVFAALTAPTQPSITAVSTDNVINAAERPGGALVVGQADPGAKVTLRWDGSAQSHDVYADGTGRWEYTPAADDIPSVDGPTGVSATASDRYGNVSEPVRQAVTVDLTRPALVVVDPVNGTDVIGPGSAGAPVVVQGRGEPGAKVLIGWKGTVAKEVTVGSDGSWRTTLDPANLPANGSADLRAVQRDAAGNLGDEVSHPVLIARQVTAITLLPVSYTDGILGVSRAEAERGVAISGIAPPGSVLQVNWGGTEPHFARANADGYWQVSFALGEVPIDGAPVLTVTGTDATGAALATVSQAVTVDTTPPQPPQFGDIAVDGVINAVEKAGGVEVGGTGEAGTKVTVRWNGYEHSQTVTDAGEWSVTFAGTEVPGDTAASTITATLTDAQGNVSSAREKRVAIDTTPPSAVQLALKTDTGVGSATGPGTDKADGKTRDGTIIVSGLTSGGSWEYSLDGGGSWIPGQGNSFLLPEGTYAAGSVLARQLDAAGNVSPNSAPTGPLLVASSPPQIVIDQVAGDDKVNAAEKALPLKITGSIADWNAANPVTVTVRWGATGTPKTAVFDSKGGWSVTFAPGELPATDGTKTLLVTAQDAVGNLAEPARAQIDFKTAIPAPPGVRLERDTGVSGSDGVTSNGVVLISGLIANATWQYRTGPDQKWQDGDPNNPVLTLAAGSYPRGAIEVRQVDEAGNVSPAGSINQDVTIDTGTTEPTIAVAGTNDVFNTVTIRDRGITFNGKAEPGARVTLTWLGRDYKVDANERGEWTITFTGTQIPTDGTYTLTAVATDLAGNQSSAEGVTRTVTVDTAAPPQPDLAVVAGNNIVSAAEKQKSVRISGQTQVGNTVEVTFGGLKKAASVDGSGGWYADFSATEVPADGAAVLIRAVATNARGNVSAATERGVTIDTVTPPPAIDPVNASNPVNAAQKAEGLTLGGQAEAGAVVVLQLGSSSVAATADAQGRWTARFASWQLPTDGPATLIAVATDRNGNVSEQSRRDLTFDSAAPGQPLIGTIAGDGIVTAAEAANPIAVTGTAEANAWVSVSWDGGPPQRVQADALGAWRAEFNVAPGTAARQVAVTAVVSDAAGNASAAASRAVVVAGSAAGVPVIAPVTADGIVNAAERANGVRVTGLATANSIVTLTWSGKAPVTEKVGENGVWTHGFSSTDLPDDGLATLTASVAGQSASRSVLVDRDAPAAPQLTDVYGATAGSSSDLTLTTAEKASGMVHLGGTSEAGASVKVDWAGVVKTVTADAQGHWAAAFLPGEVAPDGATTARITATDQAGNVSATAQQTVTVQTAVQGSDASETLTGAGNGDRITALGGDDLIIVPDLAFRAIDGGAGFDTLQLGSTVARATLDLTRLGDGRLSNIEAINLSGGGANHLVVNAAAILADTGGANKLIVTGDADETVTALGFVASGTADEGGHTYAIYTSGSATLWVDQTIQHVVL